GAARATPRSEFFPDPLAPVSLISASDRNDQETPAPQWAGVSRSWGSPLATAAPRPWRAGDKTLGGDRPLLMGILNVTPDSFHDGGRHAVLDQALRHAGEM